MVVVVVEVRLNKKAASIQLTALSPKPLFVKRHFCQRKVTALNLVLSTVHYSSYQELPARPSNDLGSISECNTNGQCRM